MKLNGNFTIIPNEFINDSRLDVYEFRILCYLMKLYCKRNRNEFVKGKEWN